MCLLRVSDCTGRLSREFLASVAQGGRSPALGASSSDVTKGHLSLPVLDTGQLTVTSVACVCFFLQSLCTSIDFLGL